MIEFIKKSVFIKLLFEIACFWCFNHISIFIFKIVLLIIKILIEIGYAKTNTQRNCFSVWGLLEIIWFFISLDIFNIYKYSGKELFLYFELIPLIVFFISGVFFYAKEAKKELTEEEERIKGKKVKKKGKIRKVVLDQSLLATMKDNLYFIYNEDGRKEFAKIFKTGLKKIIKKGYDPEDYILDKSEIKKIEIKNSFKKNTNS